MRRGAPAAPPSGPDARPCWGVFLLVLAVIPCLGALSLPESDGASPVLLSSRAGSGIGSEQPDPRRLLTSAEAVYDTLDTLRARFRQTIVMPVFDPPRRKEGHGTWYQKKPALFRMDFEEPPDDVIVSDGRNLWLYYPSTHPDQVVRTDLGSPERGAEIVDLQGRIFEIARQGYEATYRGREMVAGEETHRIRLEPDGDASYRRVSVWLGVEKLLVRRLEFVDLSETVRTITLDDLWTQVSLADSLFRFEPPAGVEVFEG